MVCNHSIVRPLHLYQASSIKYHKYSGINCIMISNILSIDTFITVSVSTILLKLFHNISWQFIERRSTTLIFGSPFNAELGLEGTGRRISPVLQCQRQCQVGLICKYQPNRDFIGQNLSSTFVNSNSKNEWQNKMERYMTPFGNEQTSLTYRQICSSNKPELRIFTILLVF